MQNPHRSNVLSCLRATACLAAALFLAPAVHAGGPPRVAILPADSSTYFNDVQARLQGTSLFSQVDVILASSVTPTLAQLQAYDAVLTWSNNDYANSTALGDVLADYVDAGGGVVVSVFACSTLSTNRYLLGRWHPGYEVLVGQSGNMTGAATLGTVHVPSHPVMAGVTAFNGGTSAYRPVGTALRPGATLVASWSDGKMLVAQGSQPNRVDLGFFPPSSLVSSTSWDINTDGALLMANALVHVAGSGGGAGVFCSGDGTSAACPCGNAGASGNGCASSVSASGAHVAAIGLPSLANDTLRLDGTLMPNSSALYFQGTTQLNGGQGAVFGDGLRCAGGSIVRLKAVTNVAGTSHYPEAGDPSVSVRGLVAAPGTRTYQIWYRNAAPYCSPSTFNLTNGVEVVWM